MSHYPTSKTYSQVKKYPQEKTPTFLNKKRSDAEMDHMNMKRHFDYEEKYDQKYDHYERPYERTYDKGDKYYQSKFHNSNSPYSNGFHGGGNLKNYRSKDYYYPSQPKYHNYLGNKSPRKDYKDYKDFKDYKKPFQKFTTDTDGVRNLSHCDLPSPPRKKDDHPENRKDEMYSDLNYVMNRLPQGQFATPQQGPPYQQIYQNQQNINIKIIQKPFCSGPCGTFDKRTPSNLSSSYVASSYTKRRYSNQFDFIKDSDKNDKNNALKLIQQGSNESSTKHSQEHKYESKIPKPKTYVPPLKTNLSLIEIPKHLLEKGLNLPTEENKENKPLGYTSSYKINKSSNSYTLDLEKSSYLLSKIPNKRLVSNYVNPSSNMASSAYVDNTKIRNLSNEAYVEPPQTQEKKKSFLVYDEKYEKQVKKFIEQNADKKENLRKQIAELKKSMEKNEGEVRSTKTKVYLNEWKSDFYSSQIEALDKIIEEKTKKN